MHLGLISLIVQLLNNAGLLWSQLGGHTPGAFIYLKTTNLNSCYLALIQELYSQTPELWPLWTICRNFAEIIIHSPKIEIDKKWKFWLIQAFANFNMFHMNHSWIIWFIILGDLFNFAKYNRHTMIGKALLHWVKLCWDKHWGWIGLKIILRQQWQILV